MREPKNNKTASLEAKQMQSTQIKREEEITDTFADITGILHPDGAVNAIDVEMDRARYNEVGTPYYCLPGLFVYGGKE